MIKLLGMSFSPRDNSNSLAILNYSLGKIKEKYSYDVEIEIVDVKNFDIKHCLACSGCGKVKKTGQFINCVQSSDDMKYLEEKMIAADGIAIATPVYFGMPSDLFSKFIMRTRYIRHHDFALANKVVGVMAIAGRRSGGAETTITSTWLPFIRHGCLIVGNGDKTCQFGTMGWAGGKGAIMEDEWGLEQAADQAERIYDMARIITAGKKTLDHESQMKFCFKSGTK